MAPVGSSAYQDVTETRAGLADYGMKAANTEVRSSGFRKSVSVAARQGLASNSAVHDLLECPVCMNLMYPPIHQVRFNVIQTDSLKV